MSKRSLLCFAFTFALAALHAQSDIYYRYADRPDLDVAYIQGLVLGDSATTDVVIILAKDSAAYTRLIKEIYYGDNYEFRPHAYHMVIWDCVKDHPEQRINDPEKYKGNDIVVTRDDLKRVCIYHPIDRENLVYHIARSNILHIQKIAKQKKGNHEKENNH